MTEKESVVVVYQGECFYEEFDVEPIETAPPGWTNQLAAEHSAKQILKGWLASTSKSCEISEDVDDSKDWTVDGVYGGHDDYGTWMAVCSPYRGSQVEFMFHM